MDTHDSHQPIQHQCYLSIDRIELRRIPYTQSNGLLIPLNHVSKVFYSYSTLNETYPPQRTSTAMTIAESKLIVMVKILRSALIVSRSGTLIMYTNHGIPLLRCSRILIPIKITSRKRRQLDNPGNMPRPLRSGLQRLHPRPRTQMTVLIYYHPPVRPTGHTRQ